MKKLLVALGLALTMTVTFVAPALADNPPNNVGQQTKPMATETPGAVAASVHASQEYAASIGIPVGQHFKNYFESHNLIPGHDPLFPYK